MGFDPVAYSHQLEDALGVPPLVRVRGKGPFDTDWSKAPRVERARWRRKLEGWSGNLGIVTGNGLVGIDVDLYAEGAEDSWDALRDRGFTTYTVTTITGGGGRHYLYATPPELSIPSHPLNGYDGIDVKGQGGCLVIPPSIHPVTGAQYEWEFNWGPLDSVLVKLDVPQLELLGAGTRTRDAERELDQRDEEAVRIMCAHFGGHSPHRKARTIEVTRPGKEHGCSAEVGYLGPGVVTVWSTHWTGLAPGVHELWKLRKLAGIPPKQFKIRDADRTTFVRAAMLSSRQQRWLWEGFVPSGQLVLAGGPEKLGKSTACLWIAARATRGELLGDYEGQPINVVVISAEDDAERVLKPRAVAAGADLERLYFLDPEGAGFSLAELDAFDVKLAVLDPMSVFVELTSSNEHGEMNVRNALGPFGALAHRRDMTVLGVRHTRKGSSGDNPYDVVLGSRAWTAAPRQVLFFTKDTEHEDRAGGLLFARGNLARESGARRYRLDPVIVALDEGGTTEVPLFAIEEGAVGISLEDALGPRERTSTRAEAEEFLREVLDEGALPEKEVQERAVAAEISPRTLRRAKKEIGVVSRRRGFGPGSVIYWELAPIDDRNTA